MSKASELIDRMEQETGQRIDDNGGDNSAMLGLLGAVAREMDISKHASRDDVAAGVLLANPESELQRIGKRLYTSILAGGVSPEDLQSLTTWRTK